MVQPRLASIRKIPLLLTCIITLLSNGAAFAQSKVANYSFGKYGTDTYEHFEFWAKDGRRAEIRYTYGKGHKDLPVRYAGADTINGTKCFKVRFSNGYSLYIIPRLNQLHIVDAAGKYNKIFSWEYEGPVNGIGMFCDICAEDDADAMTVLRSYYYHRSHLR